MKLENFYFQVIQTLGTARVGWLITASAACDQLATTDTSGRNQAKVQHLRFHPASLPFLAFPGSYPNDS
jgi:hypothetical protein